MTARDPSSRNGIAGVALAFVVLAGALAVALTAASAQDGQPPTAPVDCLADRVPFASKARISWDHDGVNAEKYVVEKSRNSGAFFWDGAPEAPVREHVAEDLGALDEFVFRVQTKAPDGTFSAYAPCSAVDNPAERIDVEIDATRFLERPDEVVGLGLGLNWLLDSDLHRPRSRTNVEAIADLGAGMLRFPFGHLADNYLWNTPPWDGELEPRIASPFEDPGLSNPGNRDWTWAVGDDGAFIDAMDFDEFIDISEQSGAQTVVVVNAASFKYQDGPSYEELRETAVEWVRYAAENDMTVDYWQIGNEADHPSDSVLTSAEYSALFLDFAASMRAVDSSISVGPGLIGLSPYSDEVLAAIDTEVGFVGAHQYVPFADYDGWRRSTGDEVPSVTNMQRLVDLSASPDVPIIVTETNSVGSNWSNGRAITTTKALALFELLASEHELANVTASLLWTSHTPWSGEDFVGNDSSMFFNDDENELTPNGFVARLFDQTMDTSSMLESPTPQGNTKMWASIDSSSGSIVVHLLNKGTVDQEVRVGVDGAVVGAVGDRIVFSGEGPDDPAPTLVSDTSFTLDAGAVTTVVPATGIVVLELTLGVPEIVINEIHFRPAGDAAEFIELFNLEDRAIDVGGFVLDGFLTFPEDTTIAPGGFLVLTNDLVAFHADHPDVPAIEWMTGVELDDDGQWLELLTPAGAPVAQVG